LHAKNLDELIELSFQEAKKIMLMHVDRADKDTFGVIVRAKCAVISSCWTMGARVTEEAFKQKRFDRLPEIIALIKDEEKKLSSLRIEVS
jgi:hypothetical protein